MIRGSWLKKSLYLRPSVLLLMILLSAAGLTVVFARGWEESILAYIVYPFSAWTLAAVSLRAIDFARKQGRRRWEHMFWRGYAGDAERQAQITAGCSFAVTLAYCAYNAVLAACDCSAWLGSLAFYHLVLGSVRAWLWRQRRIRRSGRAEGARQYLICGVLLLTLTAALGVMNFFVISSGKTVVYRGHMIYAAAGFTFYNLTMAITGLFRTWRSSDAIRVASRVFSLAAALVSLFFLQTALLAAFGDGGAWQRYMNLATGTGVFVLIACMATLMIRMGLRRNRHGYRR